MTDQPRLLNAGNAGPFTLSGTQTYLVGEGTVALIDPGPDVPEHVRALSSAVSDAERVMVVLTHGHPDHAGAARAVADAVGGPVLGPEGVAEVDRPLADGSVVETDRGSLIAVHTPGHTADHLCFHLPERRALFAGDLLLGKGDTTWVGEYPGCVGDYLESLERVRALGLDVIYPAHGPPILDPDEALGRYEAHRRDRIRQVRDVLEARPHATVEEVLDAVYGGAVSERMMGAARRSLEALLEHVRAHPS